MIIFYISGPDDFTNLEVTLTFDGTNQRENVPIAIRDDSYDETTEQFFARLRLDAVVNNVRIDPSEAMIIIQDDDGVFYSV